MIVANLPASAGAAQDLPPDEIQFYDNVLPPLTAADYQIEVQQVVTLHGFSGDPGPYTYTHTQRLRVAGPRFGLAPGDIFSVYPPANSQSDYSTTLPNVVLSRRTLPWEIGVGGAPSGPVVAPWMALLLLTPDEISFSSGAAASGNLTGTQVLPLACYLQPASGTLGPQFSQEQIQQYEQENPQLTVVVVDVSVEAFTAVAPQFAELPYLAHVRQINTGGQEILGINADGWFAVVVGNRLPSGSATGVYIAHLVSLEGFTSYLPGESPPPAGTTAVRLLSLASWTFNSLPGDGDFAALMANLDNDVLRMPIQQLLPNPQTPPQQTVAQALGWGYTALDYQTRLGEETVGWYRGPCLPVQMMRNMQPLYTSAEAAMLYDQNSGMFDLSFAVAWQTGRLLALANRQFVTALLDWVQQNNGISQLLLERINLFQDYDTLEFPGDIGSLLSSDLMRRLTRKYLAQNLAPKLAPAGKQTPLLGPPRDPSGLLRHLHRLPGLLSPEAVADLFAAGTDPHYELIARLRGRR